MHIEAKELPEYSIPGVESFIESEDPFYQKISMLHSDSSFRCRTVSENTRKNRMKRWLKEQDRQLVKVILILEKEDKIIPQSLFDTIHKNTATKESWDLIKACLDTHRSIIFLQSRYRKLVRNQELNQHELVFFTENCNKLPLDDFLVIFPGKSKATLLKLQQEQNQKSSLSKELSQIVDEKVHKEQKVSLCETSTVITSVEFKKEMFTDINSFTNASCEEYLSKFPPKVLRKMQYITAQISGDLYSKIWALKESLKNDLASEL